LHPLPRTTDSVNAKGTVLTAPDIVFKGSGFYVTDNRNDSGGKKKPSEKKKAPEKKEAAD